MHTFWLIVKIVVAVWILFWIVKHIRIIVVQEATAVAFKYLGKFVYVAMEWQGHHFAPNGSIVPDDNPDQHAVNYHGCCWCIWRWGGWVFYLSPLVRPARYIDMNEADVFGDGIYVKLNDITPEPNIASAETTETDEASVPLDIKFVCTMRVVNPYKWLFVSPKNATAQVTKRLDSILRAWVKSGSEKHAQSVKGNGEALWAELIQTVDADHPNALNAWPTIKKIEDDWGLIIIPESIIAQDIGYEASYQQAMQAKSKADLLADGEVQATAGRIKKAVAIEMGLTVDELDDNLKNTKGFANKPQYKAALAFAKRVLIRDRSTESSDVSISSGDGQPLPENLTYLSIGGGGSGGAGVLVGGNKGRQGSDRGGGNNRGDNRGQDGGKKAPKYAPTNEDYEKRAQAYFEEKGVYPVWDPLNRKPSEGGGKRF